jgi:hypothetical protein
VDRRTFSLAAMAMTGVSLSPQKGWSYGQCDVGTQELEIGLAKFPSRGVGSQSHSLTDGWRMFWYHLGALSVASSLKLL